MARLRIENILCPTDFSMFSARAVRHAGALAQRFGARLTVLHVWAPYATSPLHAPATIASNWELRTRIDDEMRAFVESAVHDSATVKTVVREGEPWREIQAMAEQLPADLLVMGTHGRGGFEHLLLGSVTEKILRRAPCPVLSVCHEEGRTWEAPGLIRRILCATDLSASSNPAMKFALALAQEHKATLILVHVVEALAPGATRTPGNARDRSAAPADRVAGTESVESDDPVKSADRLQDRETSSRWPRASRNPPARCRGVRRHDRDGSAPSRHAGARGVRFHVAACRPGSDVPRSDGAPTFWGRRRAATEICNETRQGTWIASR